MSWSLTSCSSSWFLERELRFDHAGETGAVYICRGIAFAARWRNDSELLLFAQQHGETETEHLVLSETSLPPWHVVFDLPDLGRQPGIR